MPSRRNSFATAIAEPSRRKAAKNWWNTWRTCESRLRVARSSSSYSNPAGRGIFSSPLRALFKTPCNSRPRRICNSASLIVPLRPRRRRSLKLAVSYKPSWSSMSVFVNAQISNNRCQSALFRASRETSSPITKPTFPILTLATSS